MISLCSLPKRQNVMTKNSSSSASFGITPTMEKLYHQGVMRSKVDDCQFVCIRQTDYYRILHQGEENTRRHEEDGVLVLVTEQRPIDAGNRRGNIVIKVLGVCIVNASAIVFEEGVVNVSSGE